MFKLDIVEVRTIHYQTIETSYTVCEVVLQDSDGYEIERHFDIQDGEWSPI